MPPVNSKVLIPHREIVVRTQILGQQISAERQYTDVLVTLKGAVPFATLLLESLPSTVQVHYITAKSYHGSSRESSGKVIIPQSLKHLKGRNVLVVEDIVDTGHTLAAIFQKLGKARANSFAAVALLDKPHKRKSPVAAAWHGFDVDGFVYGFGLDLDEQCRNLPDIMEVVE